MTSRFLRRSCSVEDSGIFTPVDSLDSWRDRLIHVGAAKRRDVYLALESKAEAIDYDICLYREFGYTTSYPVAFKPAYDTRLLMKDKATTQSSIQFMGHKINMTKRSTWVEYLKPYEFEEFLNVAEIFIKWKPSILEEIEIWENDEFFIELYRTNNQKLRSKFTSCRMINETPFKKLSSGKTNNHIKITRKQSC
jgi:hypothetical protein